MSMINEVDCSPDTPVIDAAAERMALKEMEHEEFRDTNEMSGFQRGYSRGFLEGAEFMHSFYSKREMRDHLIHLDRERKKRMSEQKKGVVDDRLLTPVEKTLKDIGVSPHDQKESFGACLRPANYLSEQKEVTQPTRDSGNAGTTVTSGGFGFGDDGLPPIGGFHD